MEETSPRVTMVGPAAAVALAVGSVAAFGAADAVGMLSDTAESVFVLAWLVGWVLLAWAVLVGGASLIGLIRRAAARRPVSWLEPVLLSACLALLVLAVSMHPLWGSGSSA